MKVIPTFKDKFILGTDFIIKERIAFRYEDQCVTAWLDESAFSIRLGNESHVKNSRSAAGVSVAPLNGITIGSGATEFVNCFRDEAAGVLRQSFVEPRISVNKTTYRFTVQLTNVSVVAMTVFYTYR